MSDFRSFSFKTVIFLALGLCLCVWVMAGSLLAWRQAMALAWFAPPPFTTQERPTLPVPTAPLQTPEGQRALPALTAMTTRLSEVVPTAPYAPLVTTIPSPTPSPTVTPTPTLTATPRPATVNIIFLGTDRNESGKGTWRTDVMALTVIEPESGLVGVLSLARDLWVTIPDHEPERLNTVDFLGQYTKYPGGGPALLNRTLQENFGFGFDSYIRIDFNGFVQMVDTLGGIDVEVDCPLEEVFADPALPGGRLLKVSPGWTHMDGITALMFVRARHATGGTDRSRRQFKVLMALREKILQLDTLPLIPKLWSSYRVNVQTDLSLPEALQLVSRLYDLKTDNIRGRIVDQNMATQWTNPKKAWVLLPDRDKIRAAYDTLLTGPRLVEAGHYTGKCPD